MHLFNFHIPLLPYQATLIPILLTLYIISVIQNNLTKVLPNTIHLLLTPFLTLILTPFLTFIPLPPLGRILPTPISNPLTYVY
ncbi:PTS transporter subunit EIIC, partial [Bacillus altitudinis]|uniref:PTS transporter subunit EIIC n=1 Tax=Bacillus altitudinis TaxID=293387 RepID=UPI003B52EE1E